MEHLTTTDQDREIIITRHMKAPQALVWKACTEVEHIDKWWGPDGFTNRTIRMDFRVGGEWEYTMTGPDGTVWPNLITYREIEPMSRMAYDHGEPGAPKQFEGELRFEPKDGGTLVTLRTVFQSKEARDYVVEHVGAIEGGKQTLAKLDAYASAQELEPENALFSLPSEDAFEVSRTFKAPRALVYRAWTEPAMMKEWFGGPDPFTATEVDLDVREGGAWRMVVKGPDGRDHPLRGTFTKVVPEEYLVFAGTIADYPGTFHQEFRKLFPPGHPPPHPEFEWDVRFEDAPEGTRLRVRMKLPDRIHRDVHAEAGAKIGWMACMKRLAALLTQTPTP